MKVSLIEVAKSLSWISITSPLLETTELDGVNGYEAEGTIEASPAIVSPGRYIESTSITSENGSKRISVPRSSVYELSCSGVESV